VGSSRRILAGILLGFVVIAGGCGKDSGKVTLRFWHGIESPRNNRVLMAKVAEFNSSHPDIVVEPQGYGAQDNALPKIMTAVLGGSPPELMWFAPVYTGRLAEMGALVPVQDFMDDDPAFKPDEIFPVLWDASRYDGRIYSIPFDCNNLALFYNADHFEEAGLTEPPSTWDDLLKTARKLTVDRDGDGVPERYGFQLPLGRKEWAVWTWECFLWQAGGELLTEDLLRPRFQEAPGVRALQFWLRLSEGKGVSFSEMDAGYKLDDFLGGRVSMVINGPWNLRILKEQSRLRFGVAPLPRGARQATNIGGENLFIFRSSPRKEKAAWEFARWAASAEFQRDWAIGTGYLPVNAAVLDDPAFAEYVTGNPAVGVFLDQMKTGRVRPPVAYYPELSNHLGSAIEKTLLKAVPPARALGEAAAAVEKQIGTRD